MKIELLNREQKIFFASDTHFAHKNICRGVSTWDLERAKNSVRDFDTLDQMNDTLINNINAKVGQNDILFHGGDWSFGGFDNIRKFRERIVCQNIHITLGNHDHSIKINRDGIQSIFSSVQEILQIEIEDISTGNHSFILNHYAICSWENMYKGWIHLFGHSHLSADKKVRQGKSMDVGVDGNNFHPYELKEILAIMNKQPILNISLPPQEHHEK